VPRKRSKYPKHAFIPDTQCRPGVPTSHLGAISRYLLEKRPDVWIHAGDNWDMPSLSSYDTGAQKGFEQLDFDAEIEAGNAALTLIDSETDKWNSSHPRRKQYKPRKIITLGNHENRIERAAQDTPWLRSTMLSGLNFRQWKPVPFLKPIVVHGIAYCHFFCRSADGKVKQTRRGQANARLQVQREGMSCTAGHQQGLDVHIQPTGDGARRRGLICGSFYAHDEDYMSPQGQNHWRGMIMKHEVHQGDYALLEVPLDYLLRAYA